MTEVYGIDVSHHQSAANMPWAMISQTAKFCICRATYGLLHDRQVVEHAKRARAAGLRVGFYHFFRSTQPIKEQIDAFIAMTEMAGCTVGDLAPALDIEDDPIGKNQDGSVKYDSVNPNWEPLVMQAYVALMNAFGDCFCYVTQRDWNRLGKPAWMLTRPLWVAHYSNAPSAPATPSNTPWKIWQKRVGPYDPTGPGGYFNVPGKLILDQNVAREPLATVTKLPSDPVAVAAHDESHEEIDDWHEHAVRLRALAIDDIGIIRDEALRYDLTGNDPPKPPEDSGNS